MNSIEERKAGYLADGWEENWGDGAIMHNPHVCILRKGFAVPYSDDPKYAGKIKIETSYVVLSSNWPPVEFINVQSYSC